MRANNSLEEQLLRQKFSIKCCNKLCLKNPKLKIYRADSFVQLRHLIQVNKIMNPIHIATILARCLALYDTVALLCWQQHVSYLTMPSTMQ